jgi:PAS domain-containing protein
VNPAFEKVSGYTREEALGRAPWDLPGLGMEEATRYEIRDAVLPFFYSDLAKIGILRPQSRMKSREVVLGDPKCSAK